MAAFWLKHTRIAETEPAAVHSHPLSERPAEVGAAASIGILGDRSDSALTEVIHRSADAVEIVEDVERTNLGWA